jgi:hypothetical protein
VLALALAAGCNLLHDSLPGDSCEVTADCYRGVEVCENGTCVPAPDATVRYDARPRPDAPPAPDAGPDADVVDAAPIDAPLADAEVADATR